MNKPLLKKFVGGAISAGGAAIGAFLIAQGCTTSGVKDFAGVLGLAFAGGPFHYVKNWYSTGQPV